MIVEAPHGGRGTGQDHHPRNASSSLGFQLVLLLRHCLSKLVQLLMHLHESPRGCWRHEWTHVWRKAPVS